MNNFTECPLNRHTDAAHICVEFLLGWSNRLTRTKWRYDVGLDTVCWVSIDHIWLTIWLCKCLRLSKTPLSDRIKASCRLPSMGPYMLAMSPFGVETAYIRIKANNSFNFNSINITHTWNFKQWIRLWSLYMILWFRMGRAIGLVVPSINPKHDESGAPFLSIASAKLGISRSKLSANDQICYECHQVSKTNNNNDYYM